jgi:hypothetical protein
VRYPRTMSASGATRGAGRSSRSLIDSAANNHQRYVRAQAVDELRFPDYDQEAWVACQAYGSCEWAGLVDLWVAYNRHLAHVLETMPPATLAVSCQVGESQSVPLRELVGQYVAHMRHHLAQLIALPLSSRRIRPTE